ncbi:calcium-binding protein [Nocardiopsis algeriensis]|uniref:Uncharacterized protein n=1 Tax=Nocardiopsis algeriensis TaxID=1478215 RepID=A0A841IP47_9ACTN|nr:calcium-binding protein [Nocardiopsis algeriensis]MBB6118131.1 hypothetical protein [Nocardiopsis algeriensis]
MTHSDHSGDAPGGEPERPRAGQRGGSPSAISGALRRDPHPGPQHWGGPRPRRSEPRPLPRFRLGGPPENRSGQAGRST